MNDLLNLAVESAWRPEALEPVDSSESEHLYHWGALVTQSPARGTQGRSRRRSTQTSTADHSVWSLEGHFIASLERQNLSCVGGRCDFQNPALR
jgi:hypothetical protein